jgi:2-polyprenyl-6-methoxyphenol hydroxylase-like FAD-dependent oxidoreductase
MGLGETLRGRKTGEVGLRIVDGLHMAWASIPVGDGGFTCPLQIHRGDLVTALYEATKDQASFIYDDSIDTVEEINETLRVTLTNRKSRPLDFDVLMVAEGIRSHTRAKIFDRAVQEPIMSLGLRVATFSFKSDEAWARCYHIPDNRAILVRPDRLAGRSYAHVICRGSSKPVGPQPSKEDHRAEFFRLFQKTGWESEKITQALSEAGDLHIQEVAQVRCKVWSKGRTVLVADAAYCPSPIGGMGATAAIIGGYILAAELIKNPADPQAAFRAYELSLRPWIDAIQKPAPAIAKLGLPETRLGIFSLHLLVYLYFASPARLLFLPLILLLKRFGFFKPTSPPKLPSPSVFDQS